MRRFPSQKGTQSMRFLVPTLVLLGLSAGGAERLSGQESAYLPPHDRPEAVAELVRSYHEAGLFTGVVLAADGDEVIHRSGHGYADREFEVANTPGTVFRLASVTKQFTAAAILRLAEEERVELDASITRYVPELRGPAWEAITLHQLLTHTAGLPQLIEELGEKNMGDHFRMDEMIHLLATARRPGLPGRQFLYSNAGYVLLAAVIESVTGTSYGEAMGEMFFGPLGMTRTGHEGRQVVIPRFAQGYVELPDRTLRSTYYEPSFVTGAGSIYSTVDDLLIWSRAVQSGKVLSGSSLHEFTRRQADPGYAYGWFTFGYRTVGPPDARKRGDGTESYRAVTHGGGAPGVRTTLRWYLDHELTVVVLSNQDDAPTNSLANQIGNILVGMADTVVRARPVPPAVFRAALGEGVASAVQMYREVQERAPDSLPTAAQLDRIAHSYLRAERVSEALTLLRLQAALFPDSTGAHEGLGEAYLTAGQPSRAFAALERALELDAGSAHASEILDHLRAVLRREAGRLP